MARGHHHLIGGQYRHPMQNGCGNQNAVMEFGHIIYCYRSFNHTRINRHYRVVLTLGNHRQQTTKR